MKPETKNKEAVALQPAVRPLYPSRDYKEYCADQKRKGLTRRHWKDLPEMWKEELVFRRELEDALNERSNAGTQRPGDAEATNATRATPPGSLE